MNIQRWNLDAGDGFAPNERESAGGEWVRWRDIEGMANELRLARESARISDEAHAMHEARAIERGSERDAARAERCMSPIQPIRALRRSFGYQWTRTAS
jgi:hypothetical protein